MGMAMGFIPPILLLRTQHVNAMRNGPVSGRAWTLTVSCVSLGRSGDF